MNDAAVLHRLHAARLAKDRGGRETKLPAVEDVPNYIRLQNSKTYDRQIEAGYFWFDAGTGEVVKTTRGAFVFYWRLLWPLKQRNQRMYEEKLRRVLADVGMGKARRIIHRAGAGVNRCGPRRLSRPSRIDRFMTDGDPCLDIRPSVSPSFP